MSGAIPQRPIFIVGAPRSGTTLLRSLLAAHPGIAVTPETHFLTTAAKFGNLHRPASDFDRFWERYSNSTRFRDLGIDRTECRARMGANPTFREAFATLLTLYARTAGKVRVGEKTPKHIFHIRDLLEWFPNARLIAVERDPRAVIASQLRSPWIRKKLAPLSLRGGILVRSRLTCIMTLAREWSEIYEVRLPEWNSEKRVLTLCYEEFVRQPEESLRDVCEFLGEVYDPEMITGRSEESVPLARATEGLTDETWREWRIQHHAQTLRPISAASLDKWKDTLSPREVWLIEGICARGMRTAGYARSSPPSRRFTAPAITSLLLGLERAEAGLRARVPRSALMFRHSSRATP